MTGRELIIDIIQRKSEDKEIYLITAQTKVGRVESLRMIQSDDEELLFIGEGYTDKIKKKMNNKHKKK